MACVLSGLACSPTPTTRMKAVALDPPVINRVNPGSGPAGVAYPVQITIEGRHFADSTNTVTFGPVTLTRIPSTENGKRIVFFAPKELPSTGEVPPSPLLPGPYEIRVATFGGESNAVTFVLTREPGDLR